MIVSHKKMNEINNKINELFSESNNKEEFYKFLKNTLNYDENYKYEYKKDDYDKYKKPYYEKNKEKINAQKAESAKRRYNQKKLEKENLKNKI